MNSELNYDSLILLDAEHLAEQGIGEAYQAILPKVRQYIKSPTQIKEIIDSEADRYAIRYGTKEFIIYSPERGGQSWEMATYTLFAIVNDQLRETPYRFFAFNGGNDLGGMFLTPDQAEAWKKKLPAREDWPYLPDIENSWLGMYH